MVMPGQTQQFVSTAHLIELLAAWPGLVVDSGEVGAPASPGSNILDAKTKNWPVDAFRTLIVEVYEGQGAHQARVIAGNAPNALVILDSWSKGIAVGDRFRIKAPMDLRAALREVLGGGSDISAANPLPIDANPGAKTASVALNLANLAAGATTALGDCSTIDLSHGPETLAITVEATYDVAANQGIRVHVRTSYDGTNYDTEDWDTWNAGFAAGAALRQTEIYDTDPYAIKVLIENLDPAQAATNVRVIATVGP
jgi:hypothetical protein